LDKSVPFHFFLTRDPVPAGWKLGEKSEPFGQPDFSAAAARAVATWRKQVVRAGVC